MSLRPSLLSLSAASLAAVCVSLCLLAAPAAAYLSDGITCSTYSDSTGIHSKWVLVLFDRPFITVINGVRPQVGVQVGGPIAPSDEVSARLTNPDGSQAVDTDGLPVTLAASPSDGAIAEGLHGLLSSDHRWLGFRASGQLPPPAPGEQTAYKLEFVLPETVQAHGAMWVSDTGAEDFGAETQPDLYVTFGLPTPVRDTSWGAIKSRFQR